MPGLCPSKNGMGMAMLVNSPLFYSKECRCEIENLWLIHTCINLVNGLVLFSLTFFRKSPLGSSVEESAA
jgi:hypothetical protein